jgi:hypothetical protein
MGRYLGVDAHLQSCTFAVMGKKHQEDYDPTRYKTA